MTGSTIIQGAPPEQIAPYTAGQTGARAPDIAALSNGGYAMTWYDDVANFGSGDSIFLSIADATGTLSSAPIIVSTGGTGPSELRDNPAIDVLSNGNIVVAWNNVDTTTSGISYRIFDANGVAQTGVLTANAVTGSAMDDRYGTPHVEGLSGGGFVISWEEGIKDGVEFDNAVVGRFFDAAGTATSGEIMMANTTATVPGQFQSPTVLELSGGNLVWTWKQGPTGINIETAITDGSGAVLTPTFNPRENTGNSVGSYSVQEVGTNSFMVIMTYFLTAPTGALTDAIVTRTFDATGMAITGDQTVVAAPLERRFPLEATEDGSGGVLITYGETFTRQAFGSERNAMLVQVDALGTRQSDAFWLETVETGISPRPETAITLLSNGDLAYVSSDGQNGGAVFHGKLFNGDDLRFSDAAQSITLGNGGETVAGLAGDDTITGGTGDDRISGGLDNDSLSGLEGEDIVTGRDGNDDINGGSGSDVLRGDSGNDTLDGGTEDDVILGGQGNDSIDGGSGNDTILGESGADTINGGDDNDQIFGFRAFEFLENHGPYDETRDGNVTNVLNGDGGNDSIVGGEGIDSITGGTGNDSLFGGAGNDTIEGGAGQDNFAGIGGDDLLILRDGDALFGLEVIDGGPDRDTLLVTGGTGNVGHGLFNHQVTGFEMLKFGAIVAGADRTIIFENTQFGPLANAFDQIIGLDVASSTEVLRVIDFGFGDLALDLSGLSFSAWGAQGERVEYFGGFRDTSVIGTGQVDHLFGEAGNDTLEGGASADLINGGDDTDTAAYAGSSAAVEINLALGFATGGDATGDTLTGIENLSGSVHNDVLTGDSDANRLEGIAGRDTLDGAGGNDTLVGTDDVNNIQGRAGDDEIIGNGGADILAGGSGFDIISWGDDAVTARGEGDADTLMGGAGNDDVSAGTGNDSVDAGGGDDTLRGQGNDDTLNGEAGADEIFGGAGADLVSGGTGADNLLGQGNGDTLLGDAGDDTLSGAAGADSLMGGADDDRLLGGTAADTLDGGTGNDTLIGGTQADDYFFGLGYESDRVNGYEQAIDQLFLDDALWAGTPGVTFVSDVLNTFGSLNTTGTIYTLDFGNGDVIELQNTSGINLATLSNSIEIF